MNDRREFNGTDGFIVLDTSMQPTVPNVGAAEIHRGILRGVEGRIKWRYYDAATIHVYTITRSAGRWDLRGTVGLSNAFKLSQRPLTFVAPHAHGEWRWPIQSVEITHGSLSASLGPPEE